MVRAGEGVACLLLYSLEYLASTLDKMKALRIIGGPGDLGEELFDRVSQRVIVGDAGELRLRFPPILACTSKAYKPSPIQQISKLSYTIQMFWYFFLNF